MLLDKCTGSVRMVERVQGAQLLSSPLRTARLHRQRNHKRAVSVQAATIMRPEYSKVTAVGTRIVVKVAELEEKTAKGIFLPDSAQKKPTSGDVVSVGKGGKKFDLTLKEGDTVLYSKFGLGVIDVEVAGVEYAILNERDCMGIMPRSNASVEDIGEIKPLGDRVLIKVDTAAEESAGGVLLTDSAKEKPMSGQVMAVGPGKLDENTGEVHSMKLKPGDRVTFFKWAGDAVETPAGLSYNILNESDVLCTH